MIVSEDRVEKALSLLAQTDLEYAHWRGQVMRAEFLFDSAKALAFKELKGQGLGVEESKQLAITTDAVKTAHEEHVKCVVEFEKLKARRKREEMVIEVWRSLNANRRVGTIQ
jgi:hypothetical protein